MSEAGERIDALLALMARLRDPLHGCPWDRAQDFASIAPHTIEEAYEVAEAIAGGKPAPLRDELGDLLFQVVFHAQLARERGWFDFPAVTAGIHDKLVRRHPHVFEPGSTASAADWDAHKQRERAAHGQVGALAGVPQALPALTRAAKLARRAAQVGFDWPDEASVRPKIAEELRETEEAVAGGEREAVAEELGDLLFAIVNWARHLGIDAEQALRAANGKFERRFAAMERLRGERRAPGTDSQGAEADRVSPQEWAALWNEVKANDR